MKVKICRKHLKFYKIVCPNCQEKTLNDNGVHTHDQIYGKKFKKLKKFKAYVEKQYNNLFGGKK